tara:strand:- start:236 stop:418 length:183 start_codon:yes stop_codon:yes gene_type:complete
MKANIKIARKIKYLPFHEKALKLLDLFLPIFLSPYKLPQEAQTNLPDKERSALKFELPQM